MVSRALELLSELEGGDKRPASPRQRPLFTLPHPVVQELLGLDVSSMTPLEAINALYGLQQKAQEGEEG